MLFRSVRHRHSLIEDLFRKVREVEGPYLRESSYSCGTAALAEDASDSNLSRQRRDIGPISAIVSDVVFGRPAIGPPRRPPRAGFLGSPECGEERASALVDELLDRVHGASGEEQGASEQEAKQGTQHETEQDAVLWDTAVAIREHGPNGHLQRFLSKFGMRAVGEIDLGRPRWREDPASLERAIESYLRVDDLDR